jgi:hypothetical protein
MRQAPTVSQLIHLLILERAERIAATRVVTACLLATSATESDRDRDRREIESEVLTKRNKETK